jgi:translocation and assembly module TamB
LSTEPLPPDYYERPAPPRRRRNGKRVILWLTGGLLGLIVLLLVAAVALLHNEAFRQYLLRIAHTKLSEVAGVDLRLRDFSVHWSGISPSVDMYDVVINGEAPYTNPPLLQVDHLAVGVQIVSLLSRQWYLQDIIIDHPVVHMLVTQNGDTNLPKTKTSSNNQTSVFDLGIRHVNLGNGEIYYNDQKSLLDADLHDLQFQASFDPGPKRYSGGLGYTNGKIHFQNLNPMVHSFQTEFDATPDTFTLKRATLTSGASQVVVSATLNDYVHPKVTATYQSSLDTGELRQILREATLPVGIVKLAGSAQFQSDPNKPVLETLRLEGNMSSSGLLVRTTTLNTFIRDISARYDVHNGDAEVQDLKAGVLGGNVNGAFKIHDVTGAQQSELHAAINNAALAAIQKLTNAQAGEKFRVTGTTNATVDATWRKTFDNLAAHVNSTLKGTISPQTGATGFPINGEIHGDYSAASQEVSLNRSFLNLPQTSVNLNGTVSQRAAGLQVQFQSNDLGEIETVADAFGLTTQPLGLGGTASFNGTVRGSTTAPEINGQLSAASLKVKGTQWQTLRTSIDASPAHVTLQNADIVPANNRGRITFNANVGLDHWAYKETSPIQVDLNASQLDLAELKGLAGVRTPMTGTVAAKISLHGSQLNPVGQGNVTLTQAKIADEPIQSANITFQGTGDEVRSRFALQMPAGAAQGALTYFPKRKGYDGQLKATGIRLDQFQTLRARNIQLMGTLNVNATGSGTIDDPGLQLTAQIPQLEVSNQTINGITLEANIANHVANVAVDSQTMNTFVRGHGTVALRGEYETDAIFDTSPISLQPVFAVVLPSQAANMMGQTELHARIRGPLKDKTQLVAQVTIPKLTVDYKNQIQLGAAEPIQMDYANGVLKLQKTSIRGTGTDLQLQGSIPINSNAPMTLLALGTIDLSIAQILNPDVATSGQIQLNVNGYGARANPDIQGEIKIVNASFAGDDLPVGLQKGNGTLRLTTDRLEIQEFTGNVSGGTLTAKGRVIYRPGLQFNLALNGNGLRTLYPEGVREGINTNLTLTGSTDSALLRGQVMLTELSFSPNFDLSDIAGLAGGVPSTGAVPGTFAQNLKLDIAVESTSDLNLSSSNLSLQGAANLRVAGTAAQPTLLGRVNVTGGDLIFRGNRYVLQPSSLDFVNPYQIQPRVNMSVDTKVQDYTIHMLFRGDIDHLRTSYTSEPSLPPSDIINLLVFGKTTEATDANPTPGNLGAESLIASSVSGQVTSRIAKFAGISQLSVDPVLGGNNSNPGARVTIEQRVTGNIFVTFATDATATQRDVIKLEYQATPRVSISGTRDQNGGFAFDVRIRKNW